MVDKIESLKALLVNTATGALFFEVSASYVRQWGEAGCPKHSRGVWNLYDVKKWYNENIDSRISEEEDDLTSLKKKLLMEKIRVEAVKADTLEEKTLPRSEIGEQWSWRSSIYRDGVLAIAKRVPALLVGKSQLEMRSILKKEGSTVLAAVFKDHKYCPLEDLPEEYANIHKDKN